MTAPIAAAHKNLQQHCRDQANSIQDAVCKCLSSEQGQPKCSSCLPTTIDTNFNVCYAAYCEDPTSANTPGCINSSSSISPSPVSTSVSSEVSSAVTTPTGESSSTSGLLTTSASSESPTASTNPTRPAAKSLSTGAKVGIGVGCAVAGAFIIGLILFFLLRKHRNKRSYTSRPSIESTAGGVGGYAYEKTSTGTKGGAAVSSLAQPAEDDAISGGMSKLRDKIKNHVQNYYHTNLVDGSALDGKHLQSWSRSSELSTVSLKAMLLAPETRHSALRSYIAWQILSRCNGEGKEVPSLLPGPVSMLAQNINNTTGREATIAIQRKDTAAKIIRQNGATTDPSVERGIAALLDVMDPVLRPFTSAGQGTEQRIRNLESVLNRAAGFAFLLFSQPSLWKFGWTAGRQSEIVVMPALQQVDNEEGRTHSPPRIFSQAEIDEK